ncbi:hypothetical protein STEG23_032154 [Scotinomys teguina]
MTVMPLGRDQDCSLKNREPDVPAPWFLDPGGWSKTAAVSLYFIFPGICTLSLGFQLTNEKINPEDNLQSSYQAGPKIQTQSSPSGTGGDPRLFLSY